MLICAATTRSALRTKIPVLDPKQFSTWTKILLTIATVFNLIYRAKKQRDNYHQYTVEDIELSKSYLIQMSQVNSFPTVIELLKGSRKLDPKFEHRSLNPILDKIGILRVCGSLIFAPSGLELAKRPILRHAIDHICRLYLEHAHRICVHQGTEANKAFVQQRYYVIGLRRTLQSIRYKCFLCRRFEPQNIETFMAPLPDCSFPTENKQFTFTNCGLDFFGPFYIEEEKDKLQKHYGLIFTCLVTRAVHLETCPDLNTDTFLNAYRRFTSRRCQPADLYSDNGKTFVGAKEELKRCLNDLDKDKIHKALAAQNTKWHFNPPHGPHFGGAWERLTQSVNWTPLIILGSRKFTFDNFHTIIVEAKAMMNSRPLTNVSDAMENEQPLMPNHFLLQRPYNSLPPVIFPSTKPANMKSWKNVQQFLNHIWRRVVREYLPTLIKQPKSTENDGNSLKVNDVVWILQVMCTH